MQRYDWKSLNPRQIGKYAEYFVKMELTMHGFDIYTSEVDDKGIDFVAKTGAGKYWDVQVKSAYKTTYSYIAKSVFDIKRDNLLAAFALFVNNEAPRLYLIPAGVWKAPNGLFVSRDYAGKKSTPEWGIQLSKKNMPLLAPYAFELVVGTL